MRLLLLAALLSALLAPLHARGECTPAAPSVVAEADRAAGDAERKADHADSVSVRSGNPGAARRAELARQEAVAARKKVAELSCTAAPAAAAPSPAPARAGTGY